MLNMYFFQPTDTFFVEVYLNIKQWFSTERFLSPGSSLSLGTRQCLESLLAVAFRGLRKEDALAFSGQRPDAAQHPTMPKTVPTAKHFSLKCQECRYMKSPHVEEWVLVNLKIKSNRLAISFCSCSSHIWTHQIVTLR